MRLRSIAGIRQFHGAKLTHCRWAESRIAARSSSFFAPHVRCYATRGLCYAASIRRRAFVFVIGRKPHRFGQVERMGGGGALPGELGRLGWGAPEKIGPSKGRAEGLDRRAHRGDVPLGLVGALLQGLEIAPPAVAAARFGLRL